MSKNELRLELIGLNVKIQALEGIYEQLKDNLRKDGLLDSDLSKTLNISISPDDTEEDTDRKISAMRLIAEIHQLKDRFVELYEKWEKM